MPGEKLHTLAISFHLIYISAFSTQTKMIIKKHIFSRRRVPSFVVLGPSISILGILSCQLLHHLRTVLLHVPIQFAIQLRLPKMKKKKKNRKMYFRKLYKIIIIYGDVHNKGKFEAFEFHLFHNLC